MIGFETYSIAAPITIDAFQKRIFSLSVIRY